LACFRAYNDAVPSPVSRHGEQAPAADVDVAATERLLHRRHGWAWITVVSLIGFAGYAVIGTLFFPRPAGAVGDVSRAIVVVLLGLAAAGLIVVIVDTARLHHLDAPVRAEARARAVHHPVVAHAYRYPPKHPIAGVFGKLLLALWIALTISFLPNQVNAVGFLAGAGRSTTFFPSSYGQECGRGGCHTVTDGTIASGSRTVDATWPYQVQLGRPFSVRAPVWANYGTVQLVGSDGNAVASIIVGLFFDVVAVIAVVSFVIMIRHWLLRRRGLGREQPLQVAQGLGNLAAHPGGDQPE
jgi:hypothetical protein